MKTITHIAKPVDSRCKWFQAELRKDLTVQDLENTKFNYYGKNSDLELPVDTLLIDYEENHHTKNRGSTVHIGIVTENEETPVIWIKPTMEMKQIIKKEGHQDLMIGSGDIKACIRIAIYLNRQQNKLEAFLKLVR